MEDILGVLPVVHIELTRAQRTRAIEDGAYPPGCRRAFEEGGMHTRGRTRARARAHNDHT